MNRTLVILLAVVGFAACRPAQPAADAVPCPDALMAYAERYPAAEPQDLYKLVFQDLYGPGHLLTDTVSCITYLQRELATMDSLTGLPPYEYTLCDSHFVRVNLTLVASGCLSVEALADAVVRSAEGLPTPEPRFVLSHSPAFREAYHPHYRIVRRDIFEHEILPLINQQK